MHDSSYAKDFLFLFLQVMLLSSVNFLFFNFIFLLCV